MLTELDDFKTRQRGVWIWRNANQAADGRFRLPQEYLLSTIRL